MPKYTLENKEKKQRFVARIVDTENAPLTASAVVALIDKRSMKDVKASKIHANLSDAAKQGFIGKTRFQAAGDSRAYVHYHPVGMVIPGESIPIPAFEKKGGYTKTPAADAIASDSKPDAVKVAEKVLADLGASDDDFYPKPTAEEVAKWGEDYDPALGVTRIVKVEGGFVEMQNDIVLGFTTSVIGHIAQSLFVEHDVAERMLLDALNGVNTLGRSRLVCELRALVGVVRNKMVE